MYGEDESPGMEEKSGIVEIEPDIKNITLNEYIQYEVKMERRLTSVLDPKEFQIFMRRMGAESLRVIKQEEAMVEDCDEGDMDNIWDITVKEVPLLPYSDEVKVVWEVEPNKDIDSISIQR
ncbi:hypothetical protein Tco_0073172 [Tanacetum coccineum]